MTPQDLLRDLRDIHLPPDAQALPADGMALWPFVLLALVVALLLALGLWRRSSWRRRAKGRLRAIGNGGDVVEQWADLVTLAVEVARGKRRALPLPAVCYRDPDAVGPEEVDLLRRHLQAELRR